jgi:MFS family permease
VLGARRIFLSGIVLVLLGGVVGGLGQNLAMLTVARVLIGIGTSAAFPCAMVLIRRRAQDAGLDAPPGAVLGGIAIAGMATAAVGPPIGGLLVGAAGWRWAFLINIPVTVIAMVMAVRWLPKDPALDRADSGFRRVADRIDLPGILGFAVTMTALVIFLMGLPPSSGPRSPSSYWPPCPRSGGSCARPGRSSTSAASPPTAPSPAPICARGSPCSAPTP